MPPRAKLPPGEGRRVPLGMRTTLEMRARVERAAADSGRSLSQEVEFRLMQSFDFNEEKSGPVVKAAAKIGEQRVQIETLAILMHHSQTRYRKPFLPWMSVAPEERDVWRAQAWAVWHGGGL